MKKIIRNVFFMKLFCFIVLFFSPVSIWGYGSAKVNKVWIEQGTQNNGDTGMTVHIDLNTSNVKNNIIRPIVYFYDGKKQKLIGGIPNYKTSDGQVANSLTSKSIYDYSHWKDFKIFVPYYAIPMSSGKTYYISVAVYDDNQKIFLCPSQDYVSFVGKDSGNIRNNNYQAQNRSDSNSGERKWREDASFGMFYICVEKNGITNKTLYGPCRACRGTAICGGCYGTGACGICQGRGGIITSGYGNYIPCTACLQTGRCKICNGTGKCACANYEYPGYSPGSSTLYGVNGQILSTTSYLSGGSSSSSSSSRSSSSSSNSSSSNGRCSKCFGTGIDPSPFTGSSPSLSSWKGYTNSSGNTCPYCGRSTYHSHDKCSSCNVPRY